MAKLAVIGIGNTGTYTTKALAQRMEQVAVYDSIKSASEIEQSLGDMPASVRIASSCQDAVKQADWVIFCVPTDEVARAMEKALPHCKPGTIISGQTSRKTPEAEAFRRFKASGLEYATLHTMCNPRASDPSKEILGLIRDESTSDSAFRQLMAYCNGLSEHIEIFDSVEEHDFRTANTQIDTSRVFLSIASSFAKARRFPWLEGGYNSPLDVMKFALAMRASNLPAHVYRNVQLGSEHGKRIVSHALEVEQELFAWIVGGRFPEYRDRVMRARDKILDAGLRPILPADELNQFGDAGKTRINSHFSIVQYAVSVAESQRNPFDDLKATTPMYTSLLCLMDSFLRNDALLEQSLAAPFASPSMREDDLVFHDQIQGWSSAILFDNVSMYDDLHGNMKKRLEDSLVQEEVKRSTEVVRVCREGLDEWQQLRRAA